MEVKKFIEVKPLDEALLEASRKVPPEELLLSKSSALAELCSRTGLSEADLHQLQLTGVLDKILATEMQAISKMALDDLAQKVSTGDLEPELLLKVVVELSKTAQKLAGRDVQKHFVLNAETLERLLED